MSRALAALAGAHVGRRLELVPERPCMCPDDCGCCYPWRSTLCGCRSHDIVGTVLRVTSGGMVVRLETGKTVRGITSQDVRRYLD